MGGVVGSHSVCSVCIIIHWEGEKGTKKSSGVMCIGEEKRKRGRERGLRRRELRALCVSWGKRRGWVGASRRGLLASNCIALPDILPINIFSPSLSTSLDWGVGVPLLA